MKFLKRSGQSNTPNNNSAVQIPIPSAVPTPSTPLANKELPPTPLFARYARTASGSFDSLGAGSNGLTPPNTGRIYGNSAGSGGSNLWVNSQSSFVLGPDGTPLVGGARDSGYSGSSGRVNSYARPEDEPPKEPIKLGRRPYSTTGAVDITKSVIVPAKSRRSSVLPDKPGNVFSNFDHRIPVPPPLPEKNSPELNSMSVILMPFHYPIPLVVPRPDSDWLLYLSNGSLIILFRSSSAKIRLVFSTIRFKRFFLIKGILAPVSTFNAKGTLLEPLILLHNYLPCCFVSTSALPPVFLYFRCL